MTQTTDHRKPGTIPLRLLKFKGRRSFIREREDVVHVTCPHMLVDDDSAFAFHLVDDVLGPGHKPGSFMYCTRYRDPGVGDIALLIDKDGAAVTRIIEAIHEDGYEVLHLDKEEAGAFKALRDAISFSELSEVAFVVATARFTI